MVPVIKGNRGIRVAADCGWANPRDLVCAMVCRPTYFSTVDNWWVANLFCSFRNYFLCLYRPGRRTPWEIRIGGVNVFAGGLLYNAKGVLVGGLGVSGDPTRPDNIAYDTVPQTRVVLVSVRVAGSCDLQRCRDKCIEDVACNSVAVGVVAGQCLKGACRILIAESAGSLGYRDRSIQTQNNRTIDREVRGAK
jgi:hypothetical protein